jgi:hypothetical protein
MHRAGLLLPGGQTIILLGDEVRIMADETITESMLKRALREALTEALQEQRGLFHDVFVEALEDFALTEAVREGKKTKPATREEVFKVLRDKA